MLISRLYQIRYSLLALYDAVLFNRTLVIVLRFGEIAPTLYKKNLKNRAARVVTGDNYEIRSSDALDKLNCQHLTQRRDKQIIILVYKLLIWEKPNF